MDTFFGPDFFTANRDKLRAVLGDDTPIVIAGNGLMQRGSDEAFAFHQDANFWYLTGLDHPDLMLVIGHHETFLVVPERSFERAAFDGAHDIAAYAARSGITAVVDSTQGSEKLKAELARSTTVATLGSLPPFERHHGIYTLPYRRRLISRLRRINRALTIRDIRPELAQLRAYKQPEELHALQKAIDITGATLHKITRPEVLGTITQEYQLEAALSYEFRMQGVTSHAFSPIVGAGKDGTTLHHVRNDGPVEPEDLIVLDVGASWEHYSADITRTVSPKPMHGRKAAVFAAVAAAQDYAISLLRPGTMAAEYEKAVAVYVGEELRKLGLIATNKPAEVRHYFPHATSHFLGLDTHDVGDYRQPYQAGMVITCEPGIYIPEEGIGVRIEDDVLITENGCEVLSRACPRMLTDVQ